ncbi:uncharacterized protein T551_03686 [Pneumocystis jirovecii RU7]|uniref:Major surface glycoprotein 2 C-terminal domain-containing protein n=1 Tax=Pneumocystis jirovecii (strain RU7) TaxID=1408657 RepID=A0A0W4ZB98_PNEJ7|nr:uncharacterized protein T551_03686 [Pneumocystis jirovecii RU7]KTW25553.1 hypothetical protein T551_03686 [Pneumocystis jirovecii RU7]
MKVFALASFLGIAYAFSKNIEFIHKKSTSNLSQNPSQNLLDLSFDLSLDSLGEEKILTLILGKDAISSQCKKKLEEYCNNLKNSNLVPKNLHPALKELCGNAEKKCNDLKTQINILMNNTNESLLDIALNISTEGFHLEKKYCNYAHVQCIFFREFPNFSTVCDTMAEQCYHQINEDFAYEVLLRALPRNLENQAACEEKIKEPCFKLNRESYYLLWSCFQKKYTCENLLKKKSNCKSLEKDIENTFQGAHKLENVCHSLLEKCYFHSRDCENGEMQNCMELKKRCEKENIKYPSPHNLPFNPLEFPPTLQEEIGFYRLYNEAASHGVLIVKSLSIGFSHFILLAYHITNPAQSRTKRCIKYLENCTFEYLTKELADLCNGTNRTEVCGKIDKEVQRECNSLQLAFQEKNLFKIKPEARSKLYTLNGLTKIIHEESYATLISKCTYIQSYCNDDLIDACIALKVAYYKAQFYKLAKEVLEDGLFGLFHNLNSDGTKKCIDKLVEKCKVVRNNSINLLSMCLKPKETCEALAEDVERKSHRLRHVLDKTRDYPREKDCLVLEKQCEDLTKDFEELNGPCATLKRNCAHLRNTKEVKDSLLSKNTDILANVDNCTTYLNRKCPRWFRREINPFNLTCVVHHKSCVIMTEEVQNHCLAFQQNMEDHKVIEKSKEDEERDNICFLWDGYCDMLTGNCPDKLKQSYNGKNGLCVTLKENCKVFREKLPLLKALMYNIKGSLTEKNICINKLNDYCTKSAHSNKTLENSCKEYSENKETRAKTCDKLISWMKILCNTLPVKLGKAAKDLKNRANEFKKTKQETEKAINNSGLFLAIPQTADGKQNHHLSVRSNIYSNNTAYVRLVRREDVLDIEPSVRQGLAFDLMSLLVELYLEAKGICNHFIQECIFEDDCPKFKDSCKKIHESCKEFVLPNAKPHVTTSISTTTLTESTTVADTQSESTVVTTMIEGKCVALHSKTTWVTSKSISTKITTSVTTLTQKCKPVPCTTEETQTRKPETRTEADHTVMPNEGIKISGLGATSIVIWVIGIFVVI